MRLFIDFPMLSHTSRQCCRSPNLWPKLVALSRHRKFCCDKVFGLCRRLLSQLAVFCRDLFSELFLGFYLLLDSVSTDFDTVATQNCCPQLFIHFCLWKLSRHNFLSRDKHFSLQLIYFVATEFSMSHQDLFDSLTIYITT